MMAGTAKKVSFTVPMDTDAIHPQSLKAAFCLAVETLEARAERNADGAIAVDWNTLEVALRKVDGFDTVLVLRAAVL